MKSKELVEQLKDQNKTVYVKIENGLYYPVIAVKQEDGNIILFCPDLTKGYKYW